MANLNRQHAADIVQTKTTKRQGLRPDLLSNIKGKLDDEEFKAIQILDNGYTEQREEIAAAIDR